MADQGGPAQPGGGGAAPQDGDLGEVRGDEADEAGSDEDTDGEGDGQGRDGEGVLIEVLEYLARNLVDNPDAVEVTTAQGDRGLVLRLRVDPEDMGKVIGALKAKYTGQMDFGKASGMVKAALTG